MKLGFIAYSNKDGFLDARDRLLSIAQAAQADCVAYDSMASVLEDPRLADILVVLGGDGSLLHYAGAVSPAKIPILGVNLGRIGFLSEIAIDEFETALGRLLAGDYTVEERMMLSCRINDRPERVCLNDFTIFKRTFSGVAQIELSINNMHINTVYCDGMIVATPTGSTAYSLSAGGPVIDQELEAILVTPVCSHTLYMRPFVAAPDAVIEARIAGDGFVTVDGEQEMEVDQDDRIVITYTDQKTRFVRFGHKNMFELIKTKLS